MVILGVDPGLAITGYGIIEPKVESGGRTGFKILAYGIIKTPSHAPFAQRLKIIYDELGELIKKHRPKRVAIEKIYFAKNVKTAMQVGEARGVVTLLAAQNKIPISEFTPLEVKQTLTGYGQASKEQIQKMVKIIFNLKEIPRPNDAADALAVAVTCWQMKNFRNVS
jgi:crossover junction endodeoxyribonuclease RuvC